MAGFMTDYGATALGDGSSIAWASATLKVVLMDASFSPAKTDHFVSGINAHEIANITGYTGGFAGSGRKTLASLTITTDTSGNSVIYDAADLTWTAMASGDTLGIYVAIIKEITNDAASLIVGYVQVDSASRATNGGDVTLTWSASGLFQLLT